MGIELPEPEILSRLRARGLTIEAERAAALRPLAESLLVRVARFADALPRDTAPPPLGPLDRIAGVRAEAGRRP